MLSEALCTKLRNSAPNALRLRLSCDFDDLDDIMACFSAVIQESPVVPESRCRTVVVSNAATAHQAQQSAS